MSGGGDVRVLCQEAGPESPRMPAWKREILERRKAKGGGPPGAPEPPAAGPPPQQQQQQQQQQQRANGEGVAGGVSGGSGRNYTITPASQHFPNNKEQQRAARGDERHERHERHESLVLQESLGPLEENPFIKLEKERRRRQDRDGAARPVQHILELYGSVPGIRTIRAENIIIIESDPDYFPEAEGVNKAGPNWQHNGVGGYSSLSDLLDRRGSAVTEIRAKEVVIYDTTLSKSEENLSTLGRPDHDAPRDAGEGQGRVSRILQKFDSNYGGKLQKKSHSTENLLDLDCSASTRPRHWANKPQPDLVPKHRPGLSVSSQSPSPVFQGAWSSKPKPQAAVADPSSPRRHSGFPQSVSSYRHLFEEPVPRDETDRGQNKLTRERDWEGAEVAPKPKVPCSPETRRARAEAPTSPILYKVSRSSSEFEIHPSPKPDLAQIPDGDTQARALANLRLQSRNSFTVIPKRRLPGPGASPGSPGPIKSSPSHWATEVPTSHTPEHSPMSTKRKELKLEEDTELDRAVKTSKPDQSPTVATSPASPPTSDPSPPSPVLSAAPSSLPILASPPSSPAIPSSPPFSPVASGPPGSSPFSPTPSPAREHPTADHLPITNIDDIDVEPSKRVPVPSPVVQRKKGNTFTVVPKRRVEVDGQSGSPEPQQEALSEALPGSTPPTQAPYSQLGTLLKKRYPAVEEIEVIGGYVSPAKSCLSKTGSTGKKLKISFNESSLHSTYEYPSESSAWDSGEEDEEEKQDGKLVDEQPSMVGRIHIPRATFTGSPTHGSNGNDLSSYIPKHSVDISSWQEHKHEDGVYQEDNTSVQPQMTEEVMLTPADSSSLSDYSSEPALYF